MRRVSLGFAGFAGLLLVLGCESSSPSLAGLDATSFPDAAGHPDAQADADAPRPDEAPTDPAPADPSAEDPSPADAVPDAPLDAAVEAGPDIIEMTLPYPLCQPCRSDLDCRTGEVQAPCLEEGPDAQIGRAHV